MNDVTFLCPVCGYPDLPEEPWCDGSSSDEICPSCGTQFGYDDAAGGDASRRAAVHRELRTRWIERGMRWFSTSTPKPIEWEPLDHLAVFDESD